MKIVALSDLHGILPDLEECDLVLLGGDLVPLKYQNIKESTELWFREDFKDWANKLPCNKVIFIAGNHEIKFEYHEQYYKKLFPTNNKITFLNHEYYEYEGLKIFGSPYCKMFGRFWAYMKTYRELVSLYKDIPSNLDVLLTHDAPFNCTDICLGTDTLDCLGSVALREAILEKQPRYALHGHLHSSDHHFENLGNTKVINTSFVGENYLPAYKPLVIEYDTHSYD
jgi:Icc-related predicted phosphoesterase